MDDKFWYYGKDAISSFRAIKEPKRKSVHTLMELRVDELMQQIGIPEHIKGFNYLHTAVMLAIDDPDIIHFMMTELYVKVANQYHTTVSRVERAMRFAIARAWKKLYFGEVESDSWKAAHKPSNSEFISAIADKVKLEYRYTSKPRYTAEEFLKVHKK